MQLLSPAGGYDKGVSVLRTQHHGDMAKVAGDIFAHYYTTGRNASVGKRLLSGRGWVGVRGQKPL